RHLVLRPGADGDEGDDRSDADDDPQHGEHRPQPVAPERAAGGGQHFRHPHRTATSSIWATRPSRMWITRPAFSATSRSWVTMTMVRPWAFSERKSAMISSPVLESSAPVG